MFMAIVPQKQRILDDLLLGLHIDMLRNVKRYGTSCRSRIAELRAEGYPVEDFIPKGERYKIYFLPASFLAAHHSKKAS